MNRFDGSATTGSPVFGSRGTILNPPYLARASSIAALTCAIVALSARAILMLLPSSSSYALRAANSRFLYESQRETLPKAADTIFFHVTVPSLSPDRMLSSCVDSGITPEIVCLRFSAPVMCPCASYVMQGMTNELPSSLPSAGPTVPGSTELMCPSLPF